MCFITAARVTLNDCAYFPNQRQYAGRYRLPRVGDDQLTQVQFMPSLIPIRSIPFPQPLPQILCLVPHPIPAFPLMRGSQPLELNVLTAAPSLLVYCLQPKSRLRLLDLH